MRLLRHSAFQLFATPTSNADVTAAPVQACVTRPFDVFLPSPSSPFYCERGNHSLAAQPHRLARVVTFIRSQGVPNLAENKDPVPFCPVIRRRQPTF